MIRALSTGRDRVVGVAVGVVAFHVVVTIAHGVVHATIPVPVTDWQRLYTGVVLFGLPGLAVAALRRRAVRTGAALLLVAGLGAFAFESLFHFVVESPDSVAAVDDGALSFGATAALSTASDAVLAATGGWFLWRQRQGSSATAPSVSQT